LPTKTSANAVYGLNSIGIFYLFKKYKIASLYLYYLLFAVLPLGVMTTPYYVTKAPKYVNMGKIGSIIAHEIIHHFDSTGILNCDRDVFAIFELNGCVLQASITTPLDGASTETNKTFHTKRFSSTLLTVSRKHFLWTTHTPWKMGLF
jgi:hypothetical protein